MQCGPRFPDDPGRYIAAATRAFILDRDGYACIYCHTTDRLTIDHIVPWTQGGSHHRMNLVTCCTICNSIAGERLFRDITNKVAYIIERRAQLNPEQLRRIERTGRDV